MTRAYGRSAAREEPTHRQRETVDSWSEMAAAAGEMQRARCFFLWCLAIKDESMLLFSKKRLDDDADLTKALYDRQEVYAMTARASRRRSRTARERDGY